MCHKNQYNLADIHLAETNTFYQYTIFSLNIGTRPILAILILKPEVKKYFPSF